MIQKSYECVGENCVVPLAFSTEFKQVNDYDTIAKEISWTMQNVSEYDSCLLIKSHLDYEFSRTYSIVSNIELKLSAALVKSGSFDFSSEKHFSFIFRP